MKQIKIIRLGIVPATVLIICLSFSLTLSAQGNQHRRIRNGIESGQITPQEAQRLRNEQQLIKAQKKIAKADGVVTPQEQKEIRKSKRRAARHIHKQKYDNETR